MKAVREEQAVKVVVQNKGTVSDKRVEELKPDKRFKDLIRYTPEQTEAFEAISVERGEIYVPILSWVEQGIVIDGYPSYEIAKKYPQLKVTVIDASFADWQEAEEMVVDLNLSRPTLNLYQKLELAFTHISYFELKAKARQNMGCTVPVQSEDKVDTLQIIADRVGCGRTTVANFKKIFESPDVKLQEECRKGDISIYSAYQQYFASPKEDSEGKKKPTNAKDMSLEMITEEYNVFEECEKGIDVGKKNLTKVNGTPLDPTPIAKKMQSEKVADGRIWIVLNKEKSAIQVFKKSVDKEKGIIQIKVNSYNSYLVSAEDGIAIFEADHINNSAAEVLSKDETDFEKASEK